MDNLTCSRRKLIKFAGAFSVAFASSGPKNEKPMLLPSEARGADRYIDNKNKRTVYTTCLGCNARCGLRCTVLNGHIKEISGNPYHPYNTLGKPIKYNTSLKDAQKAKGSTCGKPLEVESYCYNERRVITPLKRAGKRGEGKFEPISWEQLILEISQGGNLFSHIGENRRIPGLKNLLSDDPIDPQAPELGPKRNKFCFLTGRLQSGRKEFIDRFVKSAFGSINRIGHTDICGLGFRMGNFAFTGGKEVELKADPWSAKYILVFGANIYEALQPGLNTYGAVLSKRSSDKEVKFVIIDPRAQKASYHAHKWVQIMPGQDGAFALGMIRWIIENEKFNRDYLEATNEKAAQELGNGGYVNATHLIIWQKGHPRHGTFLRMQDLKEDSVNLGKDFVVIDKKNGNLCSFLSTNKGQLFVNKDIVLASGEKVKVKSALQLIKEEVFKYSISEYASLCNINEKVICEVAREFCEYAPYSATCQYHGAGNYVNGTYAAYAVAILNAFSGSIGKKGGYLSSAKGIASWKSGIYDLINFPEKKTPKGVKISREKASYQNSSLFKKRHLEGKNPYPAKRPWFPFTKGGLCVEALSGIYEGYPYGIDVLFLYFFNPVYSIPGGSRFISTLKDEKKIPLLVSIDIGINESNIYADYIIPDVTYVEGQYGWLSPHAPAFKFTALRCPAIEPVTQKTRDGRAICLETFLIDLARALKLPGFGKNAISSMDKKEFFELNKAEDFYLRAYSNICYNAGIPENDKESIEFVEKNYPLAKHKHILKEKEWNRLCYALSRGGIFSEYEEAFEKGLFKFGPKKFYLYNETLSKTICSITGKPFWGTIKYVPPIYELSEQYPFVLVSYKKALHTQSRTIWHKIALELHPENYIEINPRDAQKLGITDLEKVKITSRTNKDGIIAKVKLSEKIRPNVAAISISFGHRYLGATDIFIKNAEKAVIGGKKVCQGDIVVGDNSLCRGINPNELAMLSHDFSNTPLVDLIGGIPDFSSTCVKIEKI